jgi:adenine-specific DNA methylase
VLSALIQSNFRVADSFPVMSEYKVNPHIRNKQALDMDLILICQKNTIPYLCLTTEPTAILRRTVDELQSDIADYSDNKLFLHFMGELLKTASSAQKSDVTDYNWFSEALTHFDDFLKTIIHTNKKQYQAVPESFQLRLLESLQQFETDAEASLPKE